MSNWQTKNDIFLAAALNWLRCRLNQLCGEKEDIAAAEKKYVQLLNGEQRPALLQLAERFDLTKFEQHVLLLCVANELDTRFPYLCAKAQDNMSRPYPTFALAMVLFDEPTWDVLAPGSPLRHWRLIEIDKTANHPLTSSALNADERIVSYIKGLNYLDERLAILMTTFPKNTQGSLSPMQRQIVTTIVQQIREIPSEHSLPLIQLIGSDSLSKRQVAYTVATELGMSIQRLPITQIPINNNEIQALVRLWQRESSLLRLALMLDAEEWNPAENPAINESLRRLLAHNNGLIFLSPCEAWGQDDELSLLYDVGKPSQVEQQQVWQEALADRFSSDGEHSSLSNKLAGQFSFNLPTIEKILELVETPETIWRTCRQHARPQLSTLAKRLDKKATWNNIVLPEQQLDLLHHIAAQVRHRRQVYDAWGFGRKMNRGFGISVLFAGESGTGKTMAAEVLANALDLDLYRIDLSAVVNKYIGETEKNLRKLFDAAEESGAILLFDEADALFGKRSEVKDSHDRYANIEINYLLQRMEAYRGLAILATNMKSALDNAFMRRLRFVVDFPFPGQQERGQLWRKAFPEEVPGMENLDYGQLARFNLSGGSIYNITLNAAFAAAEEGMDVTMKLVLVMIKIELEKMEMPVNHSLLRWEQCDGVA